MLYEIMMSIRNFFATDKRMEGTIKIEEGTISLDFVKEGQYFLIEGSVSNDGVYTYPATDLTDETFDGCITLLAPPKAFLDKVAEVEAEEAARTKSDYTSESFGGYSYSRATNAAGNIAGWQDRHRGDFNIWRKL